MRTILRLALSTVLATASLVTAVHAGPPAFSWQNVGGGNANAQINDIAVVPGSGDIVVIGTIFGTVNFGGATVTGNSNGSAFVARLTNRGVVKWAFASSGGTVRGSSIALDPAENIYVSGSVSGTTSFPSGGSLVSAGGTDVFLAQFNANGYALWSKRIGGTGNETPGIQMAVDTSGNIYITGAYTGTINIGGPAVASAGLEDIFFAKFNSSGTWQWQLLAGNTGSDYGEACAVDANNLPHVVGYFNGTILLGGSLTSAGGEDIFQAKYSANAVVQWSQRRGGTGNDEAGGVAVDASGNVYTTGLFTGTTNLGGGSVPSQGSADGFLAKYNSLGTHVWSKAMGGGGDDVTSAVALDPSGNPMVSGLMTTTMDFGGGNTIATNGGFDGFFAKFTSGGTHIWSRSVGGSSSPGTGDDTGSAIASDALGNAIGGGYFSGNATLGGPAVTVNGAWHDAFLVKYGVGEPAITQIKDIGNDQGRSVRISVNRSLLDDGTSAKPITEYQAFRRVLPLPNLTIGGPTTVPSGTWEYVASVPASAASTYRIVAPTLADSTKTLGMYRTKFFVRAATADPVVFFDSPVDSGYSLDNLSPGVPANFVYTAGTLHWNPSTAADFDYFSVYGSNTNSFASATLINYTTGVAMNVSAMVRNYYWVTATDFSGNEGKPAKVSPLSGSDVPLDYILSVSAYPNPFNPETTVRYTLPSKGHVRLEVFGLNGEKIATLVDGVRDAGAFMANWRGLDDSGSRVGSGVYFARLSTPSGSKTYKLVLLK